MAMNPYVGWGISTLALYFLNKASNNDSSAEDPSSLNANQTKIGTTIPVIIGRSLVKSPLTTYFGDFRAERYTETYAAHATFSAWPIILSTLMELLAKPITGMAAKPHTHSWSGGNEGGPVGGTTSVEEPDAPLPHKEIESGKYLMLAVQWLLSWLINQRNLKTTIQKGFKYYLGYQQLICCSNVNMRVRGIYLNEKLVWEGDESREKHTGGAFIVSINDDELFGGPDENGGFVGEVRVYLGGKNQPADEWMKNQMMADSVQAELRGLTPAYRPYVSIVVPTSYVGKQALIPTTWIDMQFIPNNLGLGAIGDEANPAEAIYELHTNKNWGLAESPDFLNVDSLKEIGLKLAKEKIGVSLQLTSKEEAGSLIDNICDHINAVRYVDPRTGKLTFKLIRDDYNVSTIKRLDVNNCSSIEFNRLDWIETISCASVSYTDRNAKYEQSTLDYTDPANIEITGTKTTKSYSYPYFTSAENALWAAKREVRQQSYPIATLSIEGNRSLSNVRIGEVILLNWEPYQIKNMLLRVTDVDIGDFIEGVVKIEAMEDVFGLEKTEFDFSSSTEWNPNPSYPSGVQSFRYLEMPWELSQSKDTFVSALSVRPDEKTEQWTVWRRRAGHDFESTNSMTNWSAAGRLVYDYQEFTDAEDIAGFEITDLGGVKDLDIADTSGARKGNKIIVVGDEMMAYSSLVQMPNGHWRVKGILRGIFDTVPQKHGAGEEVFFVRSGYYANVTTGGPVITSGDVTTENYNITTASVDKKEEPDVVKIRQVKTTRRAERPNAPGRIRMSAHLQTDVTNTNKIARDLTLSWVPRNKQFSFGCVGQDDIKEYYTGAEFKEPDNVDYLVRVTVGQKVKDYTALKAPFNYGYEQWCLDFDNLVDKTQIEVFSRNAELLSYQAQTRVFNWSIPMIIDGVIDETSGRDIILNWGTEDRIVIPDGSISTQKQIMLSDMAILILGEKVSPGNANSIVCYDGKSLIPNGKIMIVTGKGKYEIYEMKPGYIFASYYVANASGGTIYYQWDGSKINEYEMR